MKIAVSQLRNIVLQESSKVNKRAATVIAWRNKPKAERDMMLNDFAFLSTSRNFDKDLETSGLKKFYPDWTQQDFRDVWRDIDYTGYARADLLGKLDVTLGESALRSLVREVVVALAPTASRKHQ